MHFEVNLKKNRPHFDNNLAHMFIFNTQRHIISTYKETITEQSTLPGSKSLLSLYLYTVGKQFTKITPKPSKI